MIDLKLNPRILYQYFTVIVYKVEDFDLKHEFEIKLYFSKAYVTVQFSVRDNYILQCFLP